jgi:hypothetical protein
MVSFLLSRAEPPVELGRIAAVVQARKKCTGGRRGTSSSGLNGGGRARLGVVLACVSKLKSNADQKRSETS